MKTIEQFREDVKAKFGDKIIIPEEAEYKGNKIKILARCPEHGDFYIRPNSIISSGQGCAICGRKKAAEHIALTQEEFIERAIAVHGDKYNYDSVEYVRNNIPVKIFCKQCGRYFEQKPVSHITGCGCNLCNPPKIKETTETFKAKLAAKHPDIKLIGEYGADNNAKITVECTKHNIQWETTPHRILAQKHGCERCYREHQVEAQRKVMAEKFQEFIEEKYADIYDISKVVYVNNSTKVELICPRHGSFFLAPDKMKSRGDGCPYCHESHLERDLNAALLKEGYSFEREKTFDWLINKHTNGHLFLDFYIPELNLGIECQGVQHFDGRNDSLYSRHDSSEDRVSRDIEKHAVCKQNGLNLLYVVSNDIVPRIKVKPDFYTEENTIYVNESVEVINRIKTSQ